MTVEEFLAWEERQELRYEFDGLAASATAEGTAAHALIQVNLLTTLRTGLRGKPCRPIGSELKIRVAGHIRYPDAFVVCTPIPSRATVIDHPVVVFEILGDGSARDDLVIKSREYRATSSVQRYVVLQQTGAGATVFSRRGDDWLAEPVSGDGAMLPMPEIGIEIALADLYADVAFDEAG